jgi:phosphohistidine phosphatase
MQVVLIRHGIAEDREAFATEGEDDALRPLTKQGRWKMERVARGLRQAVRSIDVLATSPLVRATQTAEIIATVYRDIEVVTVPAFAPDAPLNAGLDWLRRQRSVEVVAVVGHEPHMGTLATWLLTDLAESRIPLRKGGACAIEFSGLPRAGVGNLAWTLTPALLRRLGE